MLRRWIISLAFGLRARICSCSSGVNRFSSSNTGVAAGMRDVPVVVVDHQPFAHGRVAPASNPLCESRCSGIFTTDQNDSHRLSLSRAGPLSHPPKLLEAYLFFRCRRPFGAWPATIRGPILTELKGGNQAKVSCVDPRLKKPSNPMISCYEVWRRLMRGMESWMAGNAQRKITIPFKRPPTPECSDLCQPPPG